MDRFNLTSTFRCILPIIGLVFCMPLTNSYAAAGCCSNHGGVAHCDSRTKHLVCKDNSQSATCMCDGSTVTPPAAKAKNTSTSKPKTEAAKTKAVEKKSESITDKQKTTKAKTTKTDSKTKVKKADTKAAKTKDAKEKSKAKTTKAKKDKQS